MRLPTLLVVPAKVASLYLPLYPFTRHYHFQMSDINRICRQVYRHPQGIRYIYLQGNYLILIELS